MDTSGLGGIVSGIASIFTTVIGSRAQKAIQRRSLRGASSLLNTEYKYQSENLKQQAELLKSSQEFELKKISLEKETNQPFALSQISPGLSFFDSITESTGINYIYILIGLILLFFLIMKGKKR